MKVAIMQPYLFPYIGYWQLMNSVDTFVVLDDVNFRPRTWMSRNRYICDGKIRYFQIPVRDKSQNRLIKDSFLFYDEDYRANLVKTFKYSYRNAKCENTVNNIVDELLMCKQEQFVKYFMETVDVIGDYLGIDTPVLLASDLRDREHPGGFEGVIQLCHILGATEYINPIGGIELYRQDYFNKNDISLKFLWTDFDNIEKMSEFRPVDLSILDLMYNHEKKQLSEMLLLCNHIDKV